MTIINPNSIAGITSVTAEADVMNFYKSNGTLGSLQLNGCNFNTTNGISTFNNLVVGGTLTYEDVKNVDSVGIVTARGGLNVTANTDTDTLNVSGISTFGGVSTFTGAIDANGDLDVDGHTNLDNVSIAGVTTITGASGTLLQVSHTAGSGGQGIIRTKATNANSSSFIRAEDSGSTYIGLLKYGTGHSAYGALGAGDGALYANSGGGNDTNITIMADSSTGYINFATGGNTERLRIDSSGRVMVGHTASTGKDSTIQSVGTGANAIEAIRFNNNAYGPSIHLTKSRSSTKGTNTIVQDDDDLGIINFRGADGSGYILGAEIRGEVDGTPGTNDMPGRLVFATTADGASSTTERLRIDSSGKLLIAQTASYSVYVNSKLQVSATDSEAAGSFTRWSANQYGPYINLGKSRSGTVGTYTVVQDDDALGTINFCAADGTDLASVGAAIVAEIDGTPGGNDVPGRLVFKTTADGAASATERLRITSDGKLGLGVASPASESGWGNILHINSASAGAHIRFTDNTSGSGAGDGSYIGHYGNDTYLVNKESSGVIIFNTNSAERLRITGDGLVKATNDLMVHGTVYGGNGGRRNWLDNGDMTIVSRYANCHFAGNYHSYGWVTDRYQNRGTNAQWSQDTNVPAGKGFVYSAKVNSGTGGSLCQSIELTRKGQHGMFANDTYWCVSLWSTQPINRSSNNGFCKDLGSNDYTGFDNVNPSSGSAYLETGETASGTSTGTFKRYYHIFQAPNSLSSNAFAVNFGWAINYSGSGGCYLTGFQCEQVPNANCKPSAYEHVDQATQLKRCQRYAFRQSDNSSATGQNPGYTRLINGYKRHDDDVHFNFFCPVPMTPYNNSSPPQGLSAWDVGTCTNMGGNLGGTVSNVSLAEMNWDTGWCMVMFDYSAGGSNVIIPSWEGFSFEVGGSHF